MLRWCAFDSAFTPNKKDGRFKGWISKGLTTYYTFIQRGVFESFKELQRSNGLEKDDFYRYLQVRSYFNWNLRETWETAEPGFLEVFLSLLKSGLCTKVVSKLYNGIQLFKQGDTDYIRSKWEKEGKFNYFSWKLGKDSQISMDDRKLQLMEGILVDFLQPLPRKNIGAVGTTVGDYVGQTMQITIISSGVVQWLNHSGSSCANI